MDERLEEIKKESKRLSGFGGKMGQEDINYLIQQAEKVRNLEEEIECTDNSFANAYMQYQKQYERAKELEEENQRYKEVLERIKKSYPVGNDEFVPVEVIYEIQMIIDKALKGETNETSK